MIISTSFFVNATVRDDLVNYIQNNSKSAYYTLYDNSTINVSFVRDSARRNNASFSHNTTLYHSTSYPDYLLGGVANGSLRHLPSPHTYTETFLNVGSCTALSIAGHIYWEAEPSVGRIADNGINIGFEIYDSGTGTQSVICAAAGTDSASTGNVATLQEW